MLMEKMLFGIENPLEAFHLFLSIAYGLNFLISGIITNVFQFLIFIIIKPFNVTLYRKINYYCFSAVAGQLEWLCEWWSSSTCLIYTDDKTWNLMGTENAIVLMHHSNEVDWLFNCFLCEQIRALGGIKVFMKKSLQMVPIIGWTTYFSENPFLKRSFDADKLTIQRKLSNFSENPNPVLLHLFAEGTRYTKAKHEASVEFALKSGLTPLKHLLIPRTKGFNLTLDILRGEFSAVYCATMVFDTNRGALPVFTNLLLGRSMKAEILIERIPLEHIPENPDQAAKWLHDNFVHKDKMIETYKTEGMFPTNLPGRYFEGPIKAHYRPRRLWISLFIVISSCFTLPLVAYASYCLFTSGIFGVVLSFSSFGIVIIIFFKLMDLNSTSKGSEYGKTSPEAAIKRD